MSTACFASMWRPESLQRNALEDAPAIEARLTAEAAEGRAACAVWEPAASLVAPRSYHRFERFEAACARFAARGWPVAVRLSGGGLVPQGPGMLNVSLAWRTRSEMGRSMEPVYEALCALLRRAIEPFGADFQTEAVKDSFCDGRYNLAVQGRKVAGTAQHWHRISAGEHVVLAHACLLVEVDLATLNREANDFEARIGSGRSYRVDAIANVMATGRAREGDDPTGRSATALIAQRLREAAQRCGPLC